MEKIWIFFQWATARLMVGSGGQNDMSGQTKDALRVCNVKIRKSLTGVKRGTSSWLFGLADPSVEQFEIFFSKMVKVEEKESPDPKLSDFEWFGEVFKIIMFNMFVWFYHIFLISDLNTCPIWCMTMQIEAYDLLYKNVNIATRGPIRHLKMAKMCWKSPTLWTSSIVCMFDFLIFDIFLTAWHLFDILTHQLNLNHLSPHRAIIYIFDTETSLHFWCN